MELSLQEGVRGEHGPSSKQLPEDFGLSLRFSGIVSDGCWNLQVDLGASFVAAADVEFSP